MSVSFNQIAAQLDVAALREKLVNHPEYFGEYGYRKYNEGTPHGDMTDIWVRYNDIRPFEEKGSMAGFNDEHDSIWYPVLEKIPEVLPIVFRMMNVMHGERLGGVLITKLAPGGKIAKHTDHSWHADYYEKVYVPIQNDKGAKFCFEDGAIEPEIGDAYWFNNANPHWVVNESERDRIAMIICIKSFLKWR